MDTKTANPDGVNGTGNGQTEVISVEEQIRQRSAQPKTSDTASSAHRTKKMLVLSNAVTELIASGDEGAYSALLRMLLWCTRSVPPFDHKDKHSAINEHLWARALHATGGKRDRESVVCIAKQGGFDWLLLGVKHRLLDVARREYALKRGGMERRKSANLNR